MGKEKVGGVNLAWEPNVEDVSELHVDAIGTD